MNNKSVNSISRRMWTGKVFIVVLLIFGSINSSFAQDIKVDINALIQETQKMSQSQHEMTLVWWIPEDFWREWIVASGHKTGPAYGEYRSLRLEKSSFIHNDINPCAAIHSVLLILGSFDNFKPTIGYRMRNLL